MARQQHWVDLEDDEAGADRQTASLAGLVVSLFLVVVGLFLVHALYRTGVIEDCMLAGRTNCDLVVAEGRP